MLRLQATYLAFLLALGACSLRTEPSSSVSQHKNSSGCPTHTQEPRHCLVIGGLPHSLRALESLLSWTLSFRLGRCKIFDIGHPDDDLYFLTRPGLDKEKVWALVNGVEAVLGEDIFVLQQDVAQRFSELENTDIFVPVPDRINTMAEPLHQVLPKLVGAGSRAFVITQYQDYAAIIQRQAGAAGLFGGAYPGTAPMRLFLSHSSRSIRPEIILDSNYLHNLETGSPIQAFVIGLTTEPQANNGPPSWFRVQSGIVSSSEPVVPYDLEIEEFQAYVDSIVRKFLEQRRVKDQDPEANYL